MSAESASQPVDLISMTLYIHDERGSRKAVDDLIVKGGNSDSIESMANAVKYNWRFRRKTSLYIPEGRYDIFTEGNIQCLEGKYLSSLFVAFFYKDDGGVTGGGQNKRKLCSSSHQRINCFQPEMKRAQGEGITNKRSS
nr:protein ILITYHIA isoform X1 [Tanacetum cinerariifolium]